MALLRADVAVRTIRRLPLPCWCFHARRCRDTRQGDVRSVSFVRCSARIVGMVFAVSVFEIEREIACVPAGEFSKEIGACAGNANRFGRGCGWRWVQRIAAVPDFAVRTDRQVRPRAGIGLECYDENACRQAQQEQPNKKFHNAVLPLPTGCLSKRQTCQCGFRCRLQWQTFSPCRCEPGAVWTLRASDVHCPPGWSAEFILCRFVAVIQHAEFWWDSAHHTLRWALESRKE